MRDMIPAVREFVLLVLASFGAAIVGAGISEAVIGHAGIGLIAGLASLVVSDMAATSVMRHMERTNGPPKDPR